jgi:DNA-binding transcriptional LysR family regulator
MHLTLRQLHIFQAIASCGSTAGAARSLPLSQSATSAALNELEHVLGVPLFDRVAKRLVVNDNGRTLLPTARALLDAARGIESLFGRGDSSAELRVHASTTIGNYLLPRVFAGYREGNPSARFVLEIGNTSDVVTAVQAFGTDVGFIEGTCHHSDIRVIPWLEDDLVIFAAPTHPLAEAARRGALRAKQLMATTWLLREPGSGTREAVELALLPHLPNLPAALTLGSSEAIKNAVAAGLGISCLSRAVVQDLVNAGRLVILRTRLPRLKRHFSVIHHRDKVLSASVRAFVEYAEHFTSATAPMRQY